MGDFVAEFRGLERTPYGRLPAVEEESLEFRRFAAMLTCRFRSGAGVEGRGRGTQRDNCGKSP
ncbi:hypothetical protein [Bifidobacterium callitrichos]|uniref:hypothetical protein n=1 Tax=Bifidobacterium callitrichos TaxID=762209 RepID=UPI0011B22A0D|nr:hypothetical protein [Bifidobacterium callitrichos]